MKYNDYLIVSVNPANNEENVALNRPVYVKFAADMDRGTINASTLVLSIVNGPSVPATVSYRNDIRTATIYPSSLLQGGKRYRLTVQGEASGVLTITGEGLSFDREYDFTTTFADVNVTPPTSVAVSTKDGYATVSWSTPETYDPGDTLKYEVALSTSLSDPVPNDPQVIWPTPSDLGSITASTSVTIPRQLAEGEYHAYVRAIDSTDTSGWARTSFFVEAATTPEPSPTDPAEPAPAPAPVEFFEVSATYPKVDQVHVDATSIQILFTATPDPSTVTAQTVYVLKTKKPKTLTLLDYMTAYAPAKALPATITVNEALVSMEVGALEDNTEYTVIVRESVRSSSGESLGEAYYWSFMSRFSPLYGDPDKVRADIKLSESLLPDKVLYQNMRDVTLYAQEVLTGQLTNIPSPIPYYAEQYVRFQTAYDVLLNAYVGKGSTSEIGSSGGGRRKLGDLEIEVSSSSAANVAEGGLTASQNLDQMKERIKPWKDRLHGHTNRGYAQPSTVVRGENVQAYPEHLTRVEFKDING